MVLPRKAETKRLSMSSIGGTPICVCDDDDKSDWPSVVWDASATSVDSVVLVNIGGVVETMVSFVVGAPAEVASATSSCTAVSFKSTSIVTSSLQFPLKGASFPVLFAASPLSGAVPANFSTR